VGELVINITLPWIFFDGRRWCSSRGKQHLCIWGCLIYIHFIKFKENLSRGTNNRETNMALRALLKLDISRRLQNLHVFGDLLLVNNYM
jgi:hypothetical protein